jgi:hypothetical protein
MHDHDAQGNEFFKCDFCRRPWADDLPMVEGHKGSLICAECLMLAYDELVNRRGPHAGGRTIDGAECALCLLQQPGPVWLPPGANVPTGADAASANASAGTGNAMSTGHAGAGTGVAAPAVACPRCVQNAARLLAKDPEYGWKPPA